MSISVGATLRVHGEIDGALRTHSRTGTFFAGDESIDLLAIEGNQAQSVSDELVMEGAGVLSHLHQVDGHGWHL